MDTSNQRRASSIALRVLLAVGILLIVTADAADAHRSDESYLYLDIGPDQLSGRVELPLPDLEEVFGLDLSGGDDAALSELEDNLAMLQDYITAETAVGADGATWVLRFDGVELLTDEDGGDSAEGHAVFPFDAELGGQPVPQELEITFTPFLDEIADRNNLALVANDWQRGVFDEEANTILVFSSGTPSASVDLGDASQWNNFTASLELGVDHIRTGPDHVFFVVVLLVPSVLVLVARKWRPAPSFGTAFVRIVLVATMFTVAHSVTFTLAGLDVLPLPPSKLVETLIALSIAAAALHNVWPIFGQREWAIAFFFGLFHGMGFAGLVGDLDIDRTTQLVSLLGRNLGIEIGQLVIIVISFPGLFILRRTRLYVPMLNVISVTLAVVSLLWVVERVGEVDLGFNDLIDDVLAWPRSLFVVIVATAAVIAYRQFEASRGRLLPVAGAGADSAGGTDPEIDAVDDDDLDDDPEREPAPVS